MITANTARMLLIVGSLVLHGSSLTAGDWPMWRHDAGRTAVSEERLPDQLELVWTRRLPSLQPAYRNARLQFDRGYEPVALGERLFIGSSRNDSVTALAIESGEILWRFFADGPVRLAPVAWRDRVFFASDDGFLYCLDAADGEVVWKFRAAPSNRKVIGNRRMISLWPVRGGPVIADDTIYLAAGVWPFEGVFVSALDAASGRVKWRNDRAGSIYGQHPHAAEAFGGVTPQGYLVVDEDELVVPCGAAYPARFDRRTGELVDFQLPRPGRFPGGWFASVDPERAREIRRGRVTFDSDVNRQRHEDNLRTGEGVAGISRRITVGGRAFSFADGVPDVEGTVHSMIAADGKLVVVTLEGGIACLGERTGEARHHDDAREPLASPGGETAARVRALVRAAGGDRGHALLVGLGDEALLEELIVATRFRVLALDTDAERIDRLRRRLDRAGVPGERATLWRGRPVDFDLPPYFASLVVVATGVEAGDGLVERLHRLVRPYGGAACFAVTGEARERLRARAAALPGANVSETERFLVVSRPGPLAGAADYTGGWSGNDALVRAPLGVLWFDDALGFFKRSPQPWFVRGVMVARDKQWLAGGAPYGLGDRVFSDMYTGRVLDEGESRRFAATLPPPGPSGGQPNQYRPPWQKDAWKPEPPQPGTRLSPLTGRTEPRVFPKSYGCDGGALYGTIYTMRSGTPAFYDTSVESGTVNISGPRSGCTNTIIPAGGLLNVPYYYEGCTCSYPLPVALAMVAMPDEHEQWASWGPGEPSPIRRLGVNLGAPGDRVAAGTVWLEHPSAGGPSPAIDLEVVGAPRYFYNHSIRVGGGRGWPWVVASGAEDLTSLVIRGLEPGRYTVRLSFVEPGEAIVGTRVLDARIQGARRVAGLDVAAETRGALRGVVREVASVPVDEGTLSIELEAIIGRTLLCGVEVVREGLPIAPVPRLTERDTSQLIRRAP